MNPMPQLELAAIEDVQRVKGVVFPAKMTFRQLIITGPPGSGKTRLINKIGGWPEEGFIDLSLKNWWRAQPLSLRPREVHLGIPFVGHDECLTVFEREFLEAPEPLEIDFARIVLPPKKAFFFSVNWRHRYMFEFAIPAPEQILAWRLERRNRESHPVDERVTLEQVVRQVDAYQKIALHFKCKEMLIYVRDEFDGMPKSVVNPRGQSPEEGQTGGRPGDADGSARADIGS